MLVLLVLVWSLGGCGESGETEEQSWAFDREYQREGLTVRWRVDRQELHIAETFKAQLEIVADTDMRVEVPDLADGFEEYSFHIISQQQEPQRLIGADQTVRRIDYEIEPVTVGSHELAPLHITYTIALGQGAEALGENGAAGGQEVVGDLFTDAVAIEVLPYPTEEGEQLDLADVKDVVALPEEAMVPNWLLIPAIVLGLLLLVVLVLWLVYRHTHRARVAKRVYKTAHEVALEALRQLEQMDLVAGGRVKLYYECISGILRYYIEHRFGLRAPESTTEEFLQLANEAKVLSGENREMLSEFLRHCDLVKFACYAPTPKQIDETRAVTNDFINATRDSVQQIEVTAGKNAIPLAAWIAADEQGGNE